MTPLRSLLTGPIALAILAIPCAGEARQAKAVLAITSPATGSVVRPGQTVQVRVASPAGVRFAGVAIIGENPIEISVGASSLPAQLLVQIPIDIACRTYGLTAFGRTMAGEVVQVSIRIDVERPDLPTTVSSPKPEIIFAGQGGFSPITLQADFPDGAFLDVTESSNVSYSSSHPSVATVDAKGIVTATGMGNASITARYGPPSANRHTEILVSVPPLPFGVSPERLDFGDQNVGTSSSRQMRLTNTTGRPLVIRSVSAGVVFTTTDTCVTSSPLAVDATCVVTVTFAPTEAGQTKGLVCIGNSLGTFGLTVTGTGVIGPQRIATRKLSSFLMC